MKLNQEIAPALDAVTFCHTVQLAVTSWAGAEIGDAPDWWTEEVKKRLHAQKGVGKVAIWNRGRADAYVLVQLNPNTIAGHNILSLSEMREVVQSWLDMRELTAHYHRLDIAVNFCEDWEQMTPLLMALDDCARGAAPTGSTNYKGGLSAEINHFGWDDGHGLEICSYNKAKEDAGASGFNTRVEFRIHAARERIEMGNERDYIEDMIIGRLWDMSQDTAKAFRYRLDRLEQDWTRYGMETAGLKWFVRLYQDQFYSVDILREFYKAHG